MNINTLNSPQEGMSTYAGINLTRLMLFCHGARTDVAYLFPLESKAGRTAYLLWFLTYAQREFRLDLSLLPRPCWTSLLAEDPDDAGRPSLSRFERTMYDLHPLMRRLFDLSSYQSRMDCKLATFLFPDQPAELPDRSPGEELLKWDLSAASEHTDPRINRLMHILWQLRVDLKEAFPLGNDDAFVAWFRDHAACEVPSLGQFLPIMAPVQQQVKSAATNECARADIALEITPFDTTYGVTVIGSMKGQFGLAQHAQLTCFSAESAGVPCAALNFLPFNSHQKESVEAEIAESIDPGGYFANVFACNADLLPMAIGQLGLQKFESRVNIYYGNWEQERLPDSYARIINCAFTAAWAPSRFTHQALKRSVSVPVSYVPLAVAVPEFTALSRQELSLPRDSFLFLFMFDASSSLLRKNPVACISAFRQAFPAGSERTGLILKVKNVRRGAEPMDDEIWQEVTELASEDKRIVIIVDDYDRARTSALQASCDVYMSLHRAEGFGYTIAESMLLGKPVIVTGYSGNTDYTNDSTAFHVNYDFTGPERPYTKLRWAQPDVEHAAWLARRIYEEKNSATEIAQAGRLFIQKHHSPEVVGQEIERQLEWCYRNLKGSGPLG